MGCLGFDMRAPCALKRPAMIVSIVRDERSTWMPFSQVARIAALPLFVLACLALRRSDQVAHPQFWAEDGMIFFADAATFSLFHNLVEPYRGYLLVVPRLIADVGALLPVFDVPGFYLVVSLTIATIACSLFALPAFRFVVRSDALRIAVCVLIALALDTSELIGNISNLEWFLTIALLLAIALPGSVMRDWSPATRSAAAAGVFLIVCTAPATLIMLPIALLKFKDRTGAGRTLAIAFAAGTVVQILTFVSAHHAVAGGLPSAILVGRQFVEVLALRTELVPMFGVAIARSMTSAHVFVKSLAAVGLVCIAFGLLAGTTRTLRGGLLLLSMAYVGLASVLPALILGEEVIPDSIGGLVSSERYYFISSCLFIVVIAMLLDRLKPVPEVFRSILLLGLFGIGIVRNFHGAPYPIPSRDWVRDSARIERWESGSREATAPLPIRVQLDPDGWWLALPAPAERL